MKSKSIEFSGMNVYVGMDVHTCVPKHFGVQAQKELVSNHTYR